MAGRNTCMAHWLIYGLLIISLPRNSCGLVVVSLSRSRCEERRALPQHNRYFRVHTLSCDYYYFRIDYQSDLGRALGSTALPYGMFHLIIKLSTNVGWSPLALTGYNPAYWDMYSESSQNNDDDDERTKQSNSYIGALTVQQQQSACLVNFILKWAQLNGCHQLETGKVRRGQNFTNK